MNASDVLRELFHIRALVESENVYGRSSVKLVDTTANTEVSIANVPDDAVIVALDQNFECGRIFRGKAGECKRPDFILFSESRQTIIVMELKRGKDDFSEIANQLRGGKAFVDYVDSIVRQFWGQGDVFSSWKLRYVCFLNIRADKRPTQAKNDAGNHTTPDRFLRIHGTKRVEFNQLAA